jgi:aerobic-type carbon monoxide dehydrogenase small subunit (CoxS/CutS family)
MENSRKKKKTVTRRAFLQSLSGGAVGAGVASRVLGKEPRSIQSGPGEMEIFSSKRIELTVNGKKVVFEAETGETLLQVLRDRLRLTGTKRICNRGECGSCTVLLDGKPVYSCHILAIQAEGKDILTVEGLASGDKLHPVQQAFIDKDSYQCGFCTPGFIMSSVALLDKNKQPSLYEIKAGLAGNLCRCGNYQKIHAAVAVASDAMRRG